MSIIRYVVLLFITVLHNGCNRSEVPTRNQQSIDYQNTAAGIGVIHVPFMIQELYGADAKDQTETFFSDRPWAFRGFEGELDRQRRLIQSAYNESTKSYVLYGARTQICDGSSCYTLTSDWFHHASLLIPFAGSYSLDKWLSEMDWLLGAGVEVRVLLMDGPESQNVLFAPLRADEVRELELLRLRHPNLVLVHDR
jgi:hypothetical protein